MSYLQNPGYIRTAFRAEMTRTGGDRWRAWYSIRLQAGDMVANALAHGREPAEADVALWRACARRMAAIGT